MGTDTSTLVKGIASYDKVAAQEPGAPYSPEHPPRAPGWSRGPSEAGATAIWPGSGRRLGRLVPPQARRECEARRVGEGHGYRQRRAALRRCRQGQHPCRVCVGW
eukprot:scaffold51_cov401-Prasinococcus_capsulatus_cf.AAC.22